MATAKPECVEVIDTLKFASTLQYVVDDHKMDDIEADNYFHSISQRYIETGDEIRVVVREGKRWHKALFEVVSVTPSETRVEMIRPWRSAPAARTRTRTRKAA